MLRRREQRRAEYRALNPLAKARAARRAQRRVSFGACSRSSARAQVPALQEGDWVLPESCAILRYLCNSRRSVPDHWCARSRGARRALPPALPRQRMWLALLRRVARLRHAADAAAPPQTGTRLRRGCAPAWTPRWTGTMPRCGAARRRWCSSASSPATPVTWPRIRYG